MDFYLIIGLVIHLSILYIIVQKKFLRWPDGIIIAALISITIFIANFIYWLILFAFFIPSSILTKMNLERKTNKIISEKSGKRSGLQVISNSLGLFLFAFPQLLISGINGKIIFQFIFAGTIFIASASADTWSTEIGTLNKRDPRYILNIRKIVPKGTSGGVSVLGNIGGLLGAALISFVLVFLLTISNILISLPDIIILFILVSFLGFSGQIVDSLLGALLQNKYLCPNCNLIVENSSHQECNTENLKKIKNYTFLDNNTVNISANLCMTILGLFLINIIHFNPF